MVHFTFFIGYLVILYLHGLLEFDQRVRGIYALCCVFH